MGPELSRRLAQDFNMPSFARSGLKQRILAEAELVETWDELPDAIRMEIVAHELDGRSWSEVLRAEKGLS